MEINSIKSGTGFFLRDIPQKEVKVLVEAYVRFAAKLKYLRYLIFGVLAIFVGYNFFVAGKSFTMAELDTILNIFSAMMGFIVLGLVVLSVIMFREFIALKKGLTLLAQKHKLNPKRITEEFHNFVKSTIGGPGLK
jgi:hypothetical protein